MKKLFATLLLLVVFVAANAQVNFIAGAGAEFYVSRYIVDDDLPNVDLNKIYKSSFNVAPHLNVGIDIGNRFRILTGFASSSRNTNYDDGITPVVKIRNFYNTIPFSVTVNTLDADSKSRFPIGAVLDFCSFRSQKVSNGISEKTYKYSDVKNNINQSMIDFGITFGYGYNITDNLGLDALIFFKYDAGDFQKNYDLYDHYAFAGLNLSVFYKFGDVK